MSMSLGRSPRTRGSPCISGRTREGPGSIPAHAGKPPRWCFRKLRARVDPRARGEARVRQRMSRHPTGRSPRTRGSHSKPTVRPAGKGSIPAHAGKPSRANPVLDGIKVDPRARGEAFKTVYDARKAAGRSPRTRGSPGHLGVRGSCGRSIPAHAGKPGNTEAAGIPIRVDPRARGEASRTETPSHAALGRSPRTRGSLHLNPLRRAHVGSIPAHAGKPGNFTPPDQTVQVDPRARGEAPTIASTIGATRGRSPRTRGSHPIAADLDRLLRSIPAHAGKPSSPRASQPKGQVDPRARGEACSASIGVMSVPGRSPRTRGSRECSRIGPCRTGSIPAHAGKPRTRRRRSCRLGVDPRARGEARKYDVPALAEKGRSPRTRGSHLVEGWSEPDYGSIPAHAGKPVVRLARERSVRVDPRARGEATARSHQLQAS